MPDLRIIKRTRALCPSCMRVVDAEVVEAEGTIRLRRTCPEHGAFECDHMFAHPDIYHALNGIHQQRRAIPEGLLIKVTSRCNLSCPYCFMRANEHEDEEPSLEEIVRRASAFPGDVIYISGGEPTVRDDLPPMIRRIKQLGHRVILFSNGIRLADRAYASGLDAAGLDAVMLQFDSVDDEDYLRIRGERLLQRKRDALGALEASGIHVLLFVNVVEGINDRRIADIFRLASRSRIVKLVFFTPVWNIGRRASSPDLDAAGMIDRFVAEVGLDRDRAIRSGVFGNHVFEVLRKLGLKRGIKEPPCSISCCFFRTRRSHVFIDSLIDLDRANRHLRRIDRLLDRERPRWHKAAALVASGELLGLLRSIRWNGELLSVLLQSLAHNLTHPERFNPLYFMFLDGVSVLMGRFPDRTSIEFSLFKTCNLHTDDGGKGTLPTCYLEVLADARREALPAGAQPGSCLHVPGACGGALAGGSG